MIIPASSSQRLAGVLAQELDDTLCPVEYDRFVDGEVLVQLKQPVPTQAIVVGSTTDSDAHIQLLQLQDAAREAGAESVLTIIPYMGYARQDAAFEVGEPVSARAMARAISSGCDGVCLVTPHEPSVSDYFTVPTTVIEAAGELAAGLSPTLSEPVFIAPDASAKSLAETVRDAYERGEVDYFEKDRTSDTNVEITPSSTSVENRDVVLVDDIVATGSTMSTAVSTMAGNARSITVACVHPLLVGNAITRLQQAGVERIIGTDTIERPESVTSAAPAIATTVQSESPFEFSR